MVEISPTQVVLNLLELSRQLQRLSDAMDDLEIKAVEAKEAYTVAYAQAFLTNTGSVEVRRQQSMLDTATTRLASDLAETMVRAHKRKVEALRIRIDIGRSAAAMVRAEAELLKTPR